jgi:hypothetical protein
MRKHKSVVAILLAVMMIFTFMPTMAFANVVKTGEPTATGTWDSGYVGVTANNTWYSARRELGNTTATKGMIVAKLDDSDYSEQALANVPVVKDVYFYDLTGATLAVKGTMNQDEFKDLFPLNGNTTSRDMNVTLVTPDYVYQYASKDKSTEKVDLVGWNVTVKKPADYVENSENDQTVTLVAELTCTATGGVATGSESAPYRVGTETISKQVVVKGQKPGLDKVEFYRDEDTSDRIIRGSQSTTASANFVYDGSAHKITNNTVSGYTITYAVLNPSTGKYGDATTDCPTVTNVGDEKKVKAIISWTTTTSTETSTSTVTEKKEIVFTMTVTAAGTPAFGFNDDGDFATANGNYGYNVTAGGLYDPEQFVKIYPANYTGSSPRESVKKKYEDQMKAAVAADEATWKEFVKDFYTIKKTTKAAYPDYEYLTIERKVSSEFNDAKYKELNNKYAALLKNYGMPEINGNFLRNLNGYLKNGATEATVYFNQAAKDHEVEFTNAPASKTFKGNKKGKLTKDKTFTVTAVSNDGKAVSYKLVNADTPKISIDKTTGQITVKKGLKKGTYKITVKAYVVGGAADQYEKQNITIKVTKKGKKK